MTLDEIKRRVSDITAAEPEIGEPRNLNEGKVVTGAANLSFPVKVQLTHADGSRECANGTYSMTKPVVPGALWMIASSDLKEC